MRSACSWRLRSLACVTIGVSGWVAGTVPMPTFAQPVPPSSTTAAEPAGRVEPPVPGEPITPPPPSAEPTSTGVDQEQPKVEQDPIKRLLNELDSLRGELQATRQALAQANLEASQNRRELEELRQFLADHREYGDDFSKYKAVLDQTRKQANQREAEERRQRLAAERSEREVRRQAALAELAKRQAENQKMARFRRMGFSPIGLEVYTSRVAYFYETTDTTRSRIDYQPGIGNYVRLYPNQEIDYSKMTISGSVVNGSEQIRNIGVAITFFDDNGNQVGHEIVQVNNARPDVPYPFTSKVDMALNRAFASSSTYVLYADVVEDVSSDAPASTSTMGAPVSTPATQPANGKGAH
jgi:hypothetical protein